MLKRYTPSQIESMASNAPPAYAEINDQPPTDDAPPVYNEATGTLDLRQNGLSAQTQVRSQFPISLIFLTRTHKETR
jgi:hypothetical protein